jgi:Uncharacterized protein conserved in bacteria (DUF2330)
MSMILRTSLGAALLLLLLAMTALSTSSPAPACAPAPPRNQPVEIADESAIIIWDAKSKTEHFIRRATFKTYAQDFGFLVPTPTQPTLAEADDEAFTELATITAPRVVTQTRPSSGPSCACSSDKVRFANAVKGEAEPAAVRVLDEQRVAGYDAVVLEADDAGALNKWLEEHSYDVSPRLKEWVAPYVKAGWKITAFKIAKPEGSEQGVSTSAVRMTFQTDKPFFPYREPAEDAEAAAKTAKGRLLRVFFLSDARVQGTIGEKGAPWPGQPEWANHLTAEQREQLLKQVKLDAGTPPPSWWLTEFEDQSSPRPGTDDVYFTPSADQAPLEREPHIKYVARKVPDCVMCYALAAYMAVPCLLRCVRRKN